MYGTHFRKLTDLGIDGCGIKSFDLGNCPDLQHLSFRDNQFAKVDLSQVPHLESIDCSNNPLTEGIDFSVCKKLKTIKAKKSQLTTMDITGLSALTKLEADGNSLTEIKAKDNVALTTVDLTNNKLEACALDNLYRILPQKEKKTTYGKDLLVKGNPGAKTAKNDLAEKKNWTIDQKGDGRGCEQAIGDITDTPAPYAFVNEGKIWIVTPTEGYAATLYSLEGQCLAHQSLPQGPSALAASLPSDTYLVVVEAEGKESTTIKLIL